MQHVAQADQIAEVVQYEIRGDFARFVGAGDAAGESGPDAYGDAGAAESSNHKRQAANAVTRVTPIPPRPKPPGCVRTGLTVGAPSLRHTDPAKTSSNLARAMVYQRKHPRERCESALAESYPQS